MPDTLAQAIARYADAQPGESPFVTAIEGLTLLRSFHEKRPNAMIFKPALCIAAQGAKWATFGERRFDYRAGQALIVSVETPAFGRVVEASPSEPFLGAVIEFDLAIMHDVLEALEGLDTQPKAMGDAGSGVFVTDFDGPLADCALRMVQLLGTPRAIPMLSPLIMREICYWLLTGRMAARSRGSRLRAVTGSA